MATAEAKSKQTIAPDPLPANRPQLKLAKALVRPDMPAPQIDAPARSARRIPIRGLAVGAALLALLGGGGWYGHEWYTTGRFMISSDDAYVRTDMSSLSAKVAGYVADLPVAENTNVKKGTVVLRLDAGDYRLAVASAKDRIALQNASISRIGEQAKAQGAAINSAEAKVAMAEADVANTQANFGRQSTLAAKKFASEQALDQARANRDRAIAGVTSAKADLSAAQAQLDVLNAQKREAQATFEQLKTDLAKAERDLAFTEIKAPFDGIVSNRAVEPGQYVQPGQRLMALVPAGSAYVEANLKETQLGEVNPGQKAEVSVDAWGGATIEGTVESISPASGAEFSLLPPENATGNFTKITQRVPVRIRLPDNAAGKLRAGLSVVVDIDIRTGNGQAMAALE